MNTAILDPNIQEFITQNSGVPITKLALQKNPFPEIDWIVLLNQIEAKSKAKDKLPTWFAAENIIYPSKISVEQTSSERTAAYKASLISGESLIDLTGGFGVDDYYFSQKFKNIAHCEINNDLSAIVKHNFKQLKVENCTFYADDSTSVLNQSHKKWDWIYIDPSRRNDAKGKVFMLKDCLPNVPDLLNFYFEKTESILIKTAPLLDLSAGLSELQFVKNIHIIALENEVKEWKLILQNQQSLLLNQIGKLTLNEEGGLLFEPIDTLNYLTDAFGLTSIVSPPVKRALLSLEPEPKEALKKEDCKKRVAQIFGDVVCELHRKFDIEHTNVPLLFQKHAAFQYCDSNGNDNEKDQK